MTREEAIHILKQYNLYSPTRQIEEAMDMAIEALQKDIKRHEMVIRASERHLGIVRCKDCRHRDLFSCPLADNDFQKDDDYCSWGERGEK